MNTWGGVVCSRAHGTHALVAWPRGQGGPSGTVSRSSPLAALRVSNVMQAPLMDALSAVLTALDGRRDSVETLAPGVRFLCCVSGTAANRVRGCRCLLWSVCVRMRFTCVCVCLSVCVCASVRVCASVFVFA